MPILNIKGIRSFSSEDPSFPATNILASTTSTGKKWICRQAGEPSAEVVLQLENSSRITAIDIGNANSAFVAVFVSKNGSSDYQQILLESSFMSPMESRNSSPKNRVRCFSRSALVEEVVESNCKWDLVKIVCTQTFNKHVQYGLSFVKLHSPDVKDRNDTVSSVPSKLFGNFKIREDSPDSESESPQSLFSRWKISRSGSENKEHSHAVPLSAAAAIRNASTTAALKNHSPQVNKKAITHKRIESKHNISDQQDEDEIGNKKNRNRSELMYDDEDDKPNDKLDKIILKEKERLEREKSEKKSSEKKQNSKNNVHTPEANRSKLKDYKEATSSKIVKKEIAKNGESKLDSKVNKPVGSESRNKRQSSPIDIQPVKRIKEMKERVYKPFHKLLEGVVLVISGIQNPARATLRQQALDMGAKYKPDWEASCTHLICAFKNTPKYNQVHGQGKIITKDWISECYKKKMRIPWRRFALDGDDAVASESEDEVHDKSLKPAQSSSRISDDPKPRTPLASPKKESVPKSTSPSKTSESPKTSAIVLSDDDMPSDNESFDRYNLNSSRTERNEFVSSGSDTEDEVRRVLQKKTISTESSKSVSTDDIYDATTEEEINEAKPHSEAVTPISQFFKGKQFYLSDNVSSTDEIKLKRFITVYGGEVTLTSSISDYYVSNTPKEMSSEYKGEVVKPLWIFECNELESQLPTQRYNFSNW